jgi:flavin reductase (DIM6/NTAB) family NADH-FMN oxidoreductase RutF
VPQVIVLCLAAIHFVVVLFTEAVFVNYFLAKVVRPMWKKLTGLGAKEGRFVSVDKELASEKWPPVVSELPIKLHASVTELRPQLQAVDIHIKLVGQPDNSVASQQMADQAL